MGLSQGTQVPTRMLPLGLSLRTTPLSAGDRRGCHSSWTTLIIEKKADQNAAGAFRMGGWYAENLGAIPLRRPFREESRSGNCMQKKCKTKGRRHALWTLPLAGSKTVKDNVGYFCFRDLAANSRRGWSPPSAFRQLA